MSARVGAWSEDEHRRAAALARSFHSLSEICELIGRNRHGVVQSLNCQGIHLSALPGERMQSRTCSTSTSAPTEPSVPPSLACSRCRHHASDGCAIGIVSDGGGCPEWTMPERADWPAAASPPASTPERDALFAQFGRWDTRSAPIPRYASGGRGA